MELKRNRILFTILILLISSLWITIPLSAQITKGLNYSLESSGSFSKAEQTPFWLLSNRQGLSSLSNTNGYLRLGLVRPFEKRKHFSYAYGLDFVTAAKYTSSLIVHQAYLDLRYQALTLSLGSKERWSEMQNKQLSSGGLTYSGNARPIPQARIGFPEYVSVPFTNNWLKVRGHVAYGAFSDEKWQRDFAVSGNRRTEHVLYHSKALFWKIGKEPLAPFVYEGGLEMEAQFGGNAYGSTGKVDMPNRLADFLRVFVPTGGDNRSPEGEQTNIYGNHMGSWHSSLAYVRNDWKVRGYFEHYFNDHSMMFWEYGWKDGLVGLELTLPKRMMIQQIVLEYMTSKDQSGPIYNDTDVVIPEQISAEDNYYNHYIYNGWQHWGMAIGSPLMLSPIYNSDGSLSFKSNRVESFHLGFSGTLSREIDYRILYTTNRSWGTYKNPYPEILKDSYYLWEMNYQPRKLKGWKFTASLGLDRGELAGYNNGLLFTIKKTGLLNNN